MSLPRAVVATVVCAVVLALGGSAAEADSVASLTFGGVQSVAGTDPLVDLACPSEGFCAATTGRGGVVTSAAPGSAWSLASIGGDTNRLSCPDAMLCAGVQRQSSAVVASGNPLGGAATWTSANVADLDVDLSCPSDGLCVIVDRHGDVITSANPTAGAATWTTANVGGLFTSVACASPTFCAAFGSASRSGGVEVATSTNPAGGVAAWTKTTVAGVAVAPTSASCPTASFCAAIAGQTLLTSTNPAGGASAWTQTQLPNVATAGVSCTVGLCAIAAGTTVLTSSNPAGGAAEWQASALPANFGATAVACPDAKVCVVAGARGIVVGAVTITPLQGSGPDTTPGGGARPDAPEAVVGLGSRVAKVSKLGHARVLIDCRRSRLACAGRVALTVHVAVGKRIRIVKLGSAKFAVAAGKTRTISVSLTRAARSLLGRHDGVFHALLRFTLTGAKAGAAHAVTLKR